MLIEGTKVFGLAFPFLKELFLGKPKVKKGRKPVPEERHLLKKTLIAVGLISFLATLGLGKHVWVLSAENAKLKKEKHNQPAVTAPPDPPSRPTAPTPPPVVKESDPMGPPPPPEETHQPVKPAVHHQTHQRKHHPVRPTRIPKRESPTAENVEDDTTERLQKTDDNYH